MEHFDGGLHVLWLAPACSHMLGGAQYRGVAGVEVHFRGHCNITADDRSLIEMHVIQCINSYGQCRKDLSRWNRDSFQSCCRPCSLQRLQCRSKPSYPKARDHGAVSGREERSDAQHLQSHLQRERGGNVIRPLLCSSAPAAVRSSTPLGGASAMPMFSNTSSAATCIRRTSISLSGR